MGALIFCFCAKEKGGPLAQLVEHRTFNPGVAGSRPARPTTTKGSANQLGRKSYTYPVLNSSPLGVSTDAFPTRIIYNNITPDITLPVRVVEVVG